MVRGGDALACATLLLFACNTADETSAAETSAGETSSGASSSLSSSAATAGTASTDHDTSGSSEVGESEGSDTGSDYPLDDVLRLEHLQVKGTHNSYHLEPGFPLHPSHAYSHVPLDVQLEEQGIRAFELDVHNGANGLEVYHIAAIDQDTTCATFVECLGIINDWSAANPDHIPIIVWLEAKAESGGLPFSDLDEMEADVVSSIPEERLLTPDDVQGDSPTLRGALVNGWPTLGEVRGTVIIVVLDTGGVAASYSEDYTSLAGRAMFVRVNPDRFDSPVAAIAKLGESDAEDLAAAQAANILVATNTCNVDESDEQCISDRDTALVAGFHMLKDDIPAAIEGRDYWLEFPDGSPARCNPVTAPPECFPEAIENL